MSDRNHPTTDDDALAAWIRLLLHVGVPLLALLVVIAIILGWADAYDLAIVVAFGSFGFAVYFRYISTTGEEPSALAYIILVGIGLSSLFSAADHMVHAEHTGLLGIVSSLIRLVILGAFVLGIELSTGTVPAWIMRRLPSAIAPYTDTGARSFTRRRPPERRTDGGEDTSADPDPDPDPDP